MAKAMSEELRGEIRRILKEQIDGEPGCRVFLDFSSQEITHDAVGYFKDKGVLEVERAGAYRLTAYGREYWDRINTPMPIYWFKQNWFGASVALATIAASIGGIIVNALD